MFEAVRNNKRVAQVILAVLIVPFAFFGMDAYFSDGPGGSEVATVGKSRITAAEFDQALRTQQDRMRDAAGGQVDRALLDSPALRQAVLDNLVNQRLLALYSADKHFSVSAQQLQSTIAAVPAFQENGQFSLGRYDAQLRAQGMTPEMFESRLAQDLRIQQLALSVGESAFVADGSAQRFLIAQTEEREIRELRFPAARYLTDVKLADNAVQAYYDANPSRYERPARLKAEYVVLDAEAVRRRVSVSDDEVRAFYDGNQSRFGQPEERKARHILIQVGADASADELAQAQAKVDTLLARLRKDPKQFAAIAKEASQDPGSASRGGDLGFFSRGVMVKAFDDAAFSLQKDEISEPVRSDFGFHIIQVTDIKAATVRPFAEVKDEIVAELRDQAASRRYAELAEQFSNLVYEQADSLQPAAEQLGLQIRHSDWIERSAEGLGEYRNPRLAEALFSDDSVRNHRNTEAVEAGPNTLVAARVQEYEAARRLPLDEVRSQIETQLRNEAAAARAAEEGGKVLAALQKGEAAEGQWSATRKLQRAAPALPAEAMKAVFSAATAKLPAYVGVPAAEGGFIVYSIDAVHRPELKKDDPNLAAVKSQYERLMAERDFYAFLAELRQRYKVETKLPAVQQTEN